MRGARPPSPMKELGKLSGCLGVVLTVCGAVLVLIGLFARSLESEYGSGLNFSIENRDGTAIVYEVNEQADTRQQVFEGSPEDALAYTDRRREEREDLFVPNLLIALGAAGFALGVVAVVIPIASTIRNR